MCLLAAHLLQCRRRRCLHPGNGLLLSCFDIASLWQWLFLLVGLMQVVFAPPFLCVWSQRHWRSRRIILLPLGFLHVHLQEFEGLSKFVTSGIYSSVIWLFLLLYSHLLIHAEIYIYIYICWIHTDPIIIKMHDDKVARINDARKEDAGILLYKIFYLSLYL